MSLQRSSILLALVATLLAHAVPAGAHTVQAAEVEVVDALNRARIDPAAFIEANDLLVEEVPLPAPPLVFDHALAQSADEKAEEMAAHDYFAHQSVVDGRWPNELVVGAGYPLHSDFVPDANNVESLMAGSNEVASVLGGLTESASHRRHLFGESAFFYDHREVGVGHSDDSYYWAIHTAYPEIGATWFFGFAYSDLNGDGRMGASEIVDVEVDLDGQPAAVSDGVWKARVEPGRTYAVSIVADGRSITKSITATPFNSQFSFETLDRSLDIIQYDLCDGLRPTIVGTPWDDVIAGTPDDDVIVGLGGDDVIDGGGGDDVICGGDGADRLIGGAGDDRLFGESGSDLLRGGRGSDALDGGPGSDRLRGGSDADHLSGGSGDDTLTGGMGADMIDGGPGTDVARFIGTKGVVVDLSRGIARGNGADLLQAVESVDGTPGPDRLIGDDGRNRLVGGDGTDRLDGGGGPDLLKGGRGDDHLDGSGGYDEIVGGEGDNTCLNGEIERACRTGRAADASRLVTYA